MLDVKLFSLRRTFLLSLILAILTVAIVSQADIGDGDGNGTETTTSSNTTSYPTTSSATPSTTTNETNYQTQSENLTPAVTTAVSFTAATETRADAAMDQDFHAEKAGGTVAIIDDATNSIESFIIMSIQLIGFTGLFFGLFLFNYVMVFNHEDIRNYFNQSLRLAGFNSVVGLSGKSWEFTDKCRMKIQGIREVKVLFTLPKHGNPLEYGLRIRGDQVLTSCPLEMLPTKLQLIRMYLQGY
ncbi:MAG: hypothetical protein ACXAD7_15370 [Candidatus Kariarchaeaceae archaeon]|jgi:hypothetical protein